MQMNNLDARKGRVKISPSMMCANLLRLEDDLRHLERGGVDYLHADIMDGHYVPNFTLGVDLCRAMASVCSIPLDVHLMVEEVDRHIETYAGFPGARVSFHPETSRHPLATIQRIRQFGASPGVVIDPSMPVESLRYLLEAVDMVCVMTVNPGYAGQKLIPNCLGKLTELREYRQAHGLNFDIEVDGNVSWENIPGMVAAGADVLVAGTSSLFQKGTVLEEQVQRMRNILDEEICVA